MKEPLLKMDNNKRLIWIIKILFCISALAMLFEALFVNGLKPYCSYRDYNYQNDFSNEQGVVLEGTTLVEQHFKAKGNIIDGITLYLGELSDRKISVSLYPVGGREIFSTLVSASGYNSNAWNKLSGITVKNLERGKEYVIRLSCENGLAGIIVSSGDAPIIFSECFADGSQIDSHLAAGIQFTYSYMTLGSFFEFFISLLFAIIIGLFLCYAIINIENLLKEFCRSEKREGFLVALYFSVSAVLLYNPLETIRNEVTTFGRIIGAGLNADVDVSKRVSNFSHWFILFAVVFTLFYLLSNSFFKKKMSEETEKASKFLKNYMVLANCCLLLKVITYFNDETETTTAVYYFTSYAVMLIALAVLCYIALNLDEKISLRNYVSLNFIGAAISLPLAIMVALEWGKGRVFLGVWFIIVILIILYCKFFLSDVVKKTIERPLEYIALFSSLLPFLTSLYIELIHVMNQYEVFVAHPAKYYKIAIVLFLIVEITIIIGTRNKDIGLDKISRLAAPVFIFGISCLSIQIPISSTYNPDLFEGANYSVLISDFLNFGMIPIVQHYGGHMMSSVWEGIIYGIINGDYYGAAVSPYSFIILPFLVVLFYYLVKEIWDEKQAFFVALLFPFYEFWFYYGLGMLICVAAIAYIKNNTYAGAVLLWGAFVWCALYRLDLGFAFGMALILSLITYVLATKNWKSAKQLGISFAGWGSACGLVWFLICIIKGVNPISRLIEFLMINLSNQNWGYTGIGNVENTVFGWSYIIIPFLVTLALLYTTFSKTMRERIGMDKWILLLIMGWTFFGNFSRGLVRHSLVEMVMICVIWSGYLFLAMFISVYKNDARLFLPAFMVLILCNTLFVQDGNFTDASIAENAMNLPESIVESWKPTRFSEEEFDEAKLAQDRLIAHGGTVDNEEKLPDWYMTYWEQVKFEKRKVQRVELDKNLIRYVKNYEPLMDILLEDDETFVDFMNKSLIYSLLGRKNPVYVSQSPLQLSGEFTQEEFIREISGIPIVIMPIDSENYRASNSLDEVTNLYRYYKVGEFIFQNYTPLCQYGNDYAVWCLNDRKETYIEGIKTLMSGTNYISQLVQTDNIGKENVELSQTETGSVVMKYTGTDPMITELQNIMDISGFVGTEMQVCVDYSTDVDGTMQLFYTTDSDEDYTSDKVITENISGSGTAYFSIPVTEYSRIRLDTPEGSSVELKSLRVQAPIKFIDYGYDGPIANTDGVGNISYSYIDALHNHTIDQLPRIWAEYDKKEAAKNSVVAESLNVDGILVFDPAQIEKKNGNYCNIALNYDGLDNNGLYENDDEQLVATVIMGNYANGVFAEKCKYNISLKEGRHNYLVRCSTDYYWYLNQINAIKIQTDGIIYDVNVNILEGD